MKIAILGSGNGGLTAAFDWAQHGHNVRLFDFDKFPKNIEAVNKAGGIYADGALKGFAKIEYAGHDLGKVIDGAEFIMIVGPAFAIKPFAEAMKPYLVKGQRICICPSSCGGAIIFKNVLGIPLDNTDYIVSETSTLPYATRVSEPGKINVYLKLKGGLFISALPAQYTDESYNIFKEVYPMSKPVDNIFHTMLQNGNPVIHPAITLLNASRIETTNGDFLFYEEGASAATGNLMESVNKEIIEIGKKLNVTILPDPELGMLQGYNQTPDFQYSYSKAPGFKGIKAQSQLDHRYLNEDVGYGLVFSQSLGKQVDVPTPTIDAVIQVASVVMRRDYKGDAKHTMKSLGLDKYKLDELINLVS